MKKKVIALFTALFMLLSFVGCNAQGLSLLSELEKVGTWEAVNESGEINLAMTVEGENIKVNGTYEAFANQKDLQMEMVLTLKELEVSGEKLDLTQGDFKFSPIKMYMDGVKFYMSTSHIKDIARITGVDPSDLTDVKEDYIALDLTGLLEVSGLDIKELSKQSAMDYSIYKNSKVEVPFTKEGRKYALNLTTEQMVDAFFALTLESLNAQEAMLKETYKAMGMSDVEIEQVLVLAKEVYGNENKEAIKSMIEGSAVKATFDFADNKYTTNFDIQLNVPSEAVTLSMTIKDTVEKTQAKTIAFPKSVKTYTMEGIMGMQEVVE